MGTQSTNVVHKEMLGSHVLQVYTVKLGPTWYTAVRGQGIGTTAVHILGWVPKYHRFIDEMLGS